MYRTPKGQRIAVQSLDDAMSYMDGWIAPERISLRPSTVDAAEGSSILSAMSAWAWLAWHNNLSFELISLRVEKMTKRSIRGYPAAIARDELLGMHDWHLLICGVLSGNRDLMRQCALSTKSSVNKRRKWNHYFEALAGILRARILEDVPDELTHLRYFEESLPDPPEIYPARSLVRAFVRREYEKLDEAIGEGAARHWSDRYLGRSGDQSSPACVIVEENNSRIVLNLKNKDLYAYWAWPEGVFGKLVIMEGARLSSDDFWCPLGLIQGSVTRAIIRRGFGKSAADH